MRLKNSLCVHLNYNVWELLGYEQGEALISRWQDISRKLNLHLTQIVVNGERGFKFSLLGPKAQQAVDWFLLQLKPVWRAKVWINDKVVLDNSRSH